MEENLEREIHGLQCQGNLLIETAGLYQIQNEKETVEGFALGRGKIVQFCLCLFSACLKTTTYQDRISIPRFQRCCWLINSISPLEKKGNA